MKRIINSKVGLNTLKRLAVAATHAAALTATTSGTAAADRDTEGGQMRKLSRIKLLSMVALAGLALTVGSATSLGTKAAQAAVIVNVGGSNCGLDDHGLVAASASVQYHLYYYWVDNGVGGCYIAWGHAEYYYLSGGLWHYWGTYMMTAGDPLWRWYSA